MLPKTSRSTGESSCHWFRVAATPDATTTIARATPTPTTMWLGFRRGGGFVVISASVTAESY
jgi:hypothetical protein